MSLGWRHVGRGLGALVVVALALPVGGAITILLVPLWRWLEATTGIESIGHSGPAEWCYLLIFALVAAGGLYVYWRALRPRPNSAS